MHESMISHRLPLSCESRSRQNFLSRNRICIVKLPQVHQRVIHIVFRPQGPKDGAYFHKPGVSDIHIWPGAFQFCFLERSTSEEIYPSLTLLDRVMFIIPSGKK